MARPYLVGLGAAVVAGSLTGGALMASAAADARAQVRQREAAETIDNLPLPPSMRAMSAGDDCRQVNIDRCLTSSRTPPDALGDLTAIMKRIGRVSGAGCGTALPTTAGAGGPSVTPPERPQTRRCSFDAEIDDVPVRVMLWPHITGKTDLQFQGTDVWIDIVTASDV